MPLTDSRAVGSVRAVSPHTSAFLALPGFWLLGALATAVESVRGSEGRMRPLEALAPRDKGWLGTTQLTDER